MLAAPSAPAPSPPSLDELAAAAFQLEPPMPHERPHVLRSEAGLLVDGLLARVARARGAVDVAVGEILDALGTGDRVLRLGFSGLGDYARERLGVAPRTAQASARLARALRERPLLRAAVRAGDVSARRALTVLPVARGEDEAAWVARARTDTVRALEAAVRAAGAAGGEPPAERWDSVFAPLAPEQREAFDEAVALAGRHLGAASPLWQRIEALCEEFLSAHPEDLPDAGGTGGAGKTPAFGARWPIEPWLEAAKEALEWEYGRWSFLDEVSPVEAPHTDADGKVDPFLLDEDLRRLVALRDRWDEVLGRLAMLLRLLGLWRDMGFASFSHYCSERLGMSARTVEQRVALERRLFALPALRQALRDGRLSYEKARLVASVADDRTLDGWIRRAEGATCISLRREIDGGRDAQMRARRELEFRLPSEVADLVVAAFFAARRVAGRHLAPGECLTAISRHFVETWRESSRTTRAQKILARDRGLCQVPGCSRGAVHAHHVKFRSLGGGDEPENLVSLCSPHHLHGIHAGYVKVAGQAPDRLRWRLGVRAGRAPLIENWTAHARPVASASS